jgi:Polyketide cyclase / dehydrase and lipid transport
MMRIFFRVFGSVAGVLIIFLTVGVLLPGTWSADSTVNLQVPPREVFPYLNDLARWDSWTPWGDVESTFDGVTAGVGARRSWDNPNLGSGSITITESVTDRLVRYRVVVGDGGLSVEGAFVLEPADDGSTVTWSEVGDFGWNPLMGYTVLTMPESQSVQLERGLTELKRLLGGS